MPQKTASVDRTKRSLEVNRSRELGHAESGKASLQGSPQQCLVRQTRSPLCGWGTPIALPANLQLCRLGLTQTLHRQPKHLMADLSLKHSPDDVPFRRPQMQQAFVTFPGNGILRLCQIKRYRSIFQNHGIARLSQKTLHRANQGFQSHSAQYVSQKLPSL
jgi:hypothetical protein